MINAMNISCMAKDKCKRKNRKGKEAEKKEKKNPQEFKS